MHFAKFDTYFFLLFILAFSVSYGKSSTQNNSLEILYLANLNGNIENCKCGHPPLGGLDRIATIIESYRKKNADIVVIDGGDTFNTYPFLELNKAIANSYKIIQPNIWVIAEQEFFEGPAFLEQALKGNISKNILTSNYKYIGIESHKKIILDTPFTTKVSVQSYISPLVFNDSLKNILSIEKDFSSFKITSSSFFNILIFHGSKSQFNKYKNNFSNFDLILTAHQQNSNIDLQSKPAIIGGSADGENIMYISLQKTSDSININAKKIPVEIEIIQNQDVSRYISTYLENIKN